jgi:ubiquitin-conjugating enzyme E2 variant
MITLASLTIMFFYYDLFSGVLHIVLDEPAFIGTPVIGDGCLEFQWHHHIPDDLAQKSYLEVCGDLNLALFIIGLKDLVLFRGTSAVPLCLWASKMLMAYFGQLCHVMSHTPKAKRPEWVIALQDAGVMLSAKEHLIHHTKYDGNFCIGSGVFNPLLSTLRPYGDKYTWLVVFLLCGVFDVYLFEKMIKLFV